MAQAPITTLSAPLVHQALLGDEEAKAKCLKLTGIVIPQKHDPPSPPTTKSSFKQIESTRTHLKVFAKTQ